MYISRYRVNGMSVKILVVDDHDVVHEAVRMILQGRPDWQICAHAKNGVEAIQLAQELAPDVILMDITMPVMDGFEASRRISSLGIASRILIFTMHQTSGLEESVRGVGGRGLVIKSRAAQELVPAIDQVLTSGGYFNGRA